MSIVLPDQDKVNTLKACWAEATHNNAIKYMISKSSCCSGLVIKLLVLVEIGVHALSTTSIM